MAKNTKRACKHCVAWDVHPHATWGKCRMLPPIPEGRPSVSPHPLYTQWLTTRYDDWCMQFQHKDTADD